MTALAPLLVFLAPTPATLTEWLVFGITEVSLVFWYARAVVVRHLYVRTRHAEVFEALRASVASR